MKRIFVNANVVDVLTGSLLTRGQVLVEDGIIRQVGQQLSADGAERVDLGGRYLTPGLFNCHAHLAARVTAIQSDLVGMNWFDLAYNCITNAEKLLRSGVTFARDVGTCNLATCNLKRYVRSGRVKLSPDLQVVGSAVCMTGGATWNVGATQADGPDECRKAARLQLREGADAIKLYASGSVLTAGMDTESPQLSREEMAACVEEAHHAGKKACCHAQNNRSIRNALAAGVDHIEHGIGLDDETIELMLRQGAWLDPTVSALYHIAAHADQLLPEVAEKALRLEEVCYDSFRRAYAAGVPCGCGNDAGSSFCFFDETASEMVVMVEKCGLTPAQALEIGTINSAKMLGVDASLGSITPGKRAHLALFDRDPLADIRALEACVMTVKDGEILHDAR